MIRTPDAGTWSILRPLDDDDEDNILQGYGGNTREASFIVHATISVSATLEARLGFN